MMHDILYCDFIQIDNHHYRCDRCNTMITVLDEYESPPSFVCKANLDHNHDLPSFIDRIKNFAEASIQHISSGSPVCTDEQIEHRYQICRSCEFFKNHTCTKCGCPISATKKFASKLAWADQECPIGKWHKNT